MKVESASALLAIAEGLAAQLENERAVSLLAHLGGDCPVFFLEEARTARIVRAGGKLRIEVAPSFVEKYLETPRDVLFVFLHEISHRVRGDLLRNDVGLRDVHGHLLANVVADIRINSCLCRDVLPEGCGLLDRLYSEPVLPGLLLLPPHRLLARAGVPGVGTLSDVLESPRDLEWAATNAFLEAGVAKDRVKKLVAWYERAWLNERCSQARLLKELRELLDNPASAPVFLGDHEPLRAKPRLTSRRGCGRGGALDEERIELEEQPDPEQVLRAHVRRALEEGGVAAHPKMLGVDRGVVPGLGRQALVTLAAGHWPVFFETRTPGTPEEDGLARVYLDVSGSTGEDWPRIYGLVRSLGSLIAEPVFLFSTVVVPIALEDVKQGRVVTDGGTDFNAVARHVLAQRFRRVLVVTDGIGPLDPAFARALEAARAAVYLLLTEVRRPGYIRYGSGIVGVAREAWELPRPEGSGAAEVPF